MGLGRVAVVHRDGDVGLEDLDEVLQRLELVLSQGFRGEEVERAGVGIVEEPVQDGQIVGQGLARRGGGDHQGVMSSQGKLCGLGLMAVGSGDAARGQGQGQPRVQCIGPGRVNRGPGGNALPRGDAGVQVGVGLEAGEEMDEGHGGFSHQWANRRGLSLLVSGRSRK